MIKHFLLFLSFLLGFMSSRSQIITTIAGNDTFGYKGDGGPATSAKMSVLTGVALDDAGILYVSDANNSVIRKVNTTGIITTIAGNDTAGYSGDGGPATAAKINYPECLAADNKGNLYFADGINRRIRKIDNVGIISTFAGNGSATASGIGGPATAAGLGVGVVGICIDTKGNVYFSGNHSIYKVDNLGIINLFAGNGISSFTGDGGPATAANLSVVAQMEFDAKGNMFFADGNTRVRKINAAGIITTVAGNGTTGFSGDGGPATAAQFDGLIGVFPDNCDNLYLADASNNRIRKVDGHGIITTIAGTGYGAPTGGGYSGDGGPAISAEFNSPEIVYLDNNSNIYVSDCVNYCVRYIKMDGCKDVVAAPDVEMRKGDHVQVWPNPNTGMFTVSVTTETDEQVAVSVVNMMGVQVAALTMLSNREQELQLHVPAGVYLLTANTRNDRWSKQVVVGP